MPNKKSLLFIALLPLFANAQTQQIHQLKDAAQQAILTNPEVLEKWHTFQASGGERDAAFGNYLPHVDAQVSGGREWHNEPLLRDNYSSNMQELTLTQMLYDGFSTKGEVARLDHNLMERLYEVYDASESTTLEVVHAYLDVQCYRKLVALAEENYVRHRAIFDQIESKAKAGVGRRVDLEQSTGRLALAETNLLTETGNLHDVSTRYQRLVGEPPAADLQEPASLAQGLPPDVAEAIRLANQEHPAVLASIEGIRAADSAAAAQRSTYQPHVDLKLSAQHGNNINSEIGETNDKTAQVVMTWNLFNGFSDNAKRRQLAEQINASRDLRDKACREVRENLEVAYNDNRKLAELQNYLEQHQSSIEKARDAYHQQFNIGQRTLLDLLDSENEVFQAKRAYVEGQYDQLFAYARAQAGTGNLFKALGLSRADPGPLPDFSQNTDETSASNCPVEATVTYVVDKEELDRRAEALLRETADLQNIGQPIATKDPLPATATIKTSPNDAIIEQKAEQKSLSDALFVWRDAWTTRNVSAYLNAYAPTFQPDTGLSHEEWGNKRRERLVAAGKISLTLSNIHYDFHDATHAAVSFHQTYHANAFNDNVQKTLDWEKRGEHWVIVGEHVMQ